ncbi:TPA_asm: protein 4 [Asclepias syriaca virus 3]|uniref:Protein 4 n=1 Tax=Asclepias syriaca virus 3 TaxID=2977955 RepID=A0A9N6YJA7_9RHAB|nr:TPA_asm: protein 4 [Asclepias syriaca virus 3]
MSKGNFVEIGRELCTELTKKQLLRQRLLNRDGSTDPEICIDHHLKGFTRYESNCQLCEDYILSRGVSYSSKDFPRIETSLMELTSVPELHNHRFVCGHCLQLLLLSDNPQSCANQIIRIKHGRKSIGLDMTLGKDISRGIQFTDDDLEREQSSDLEITNW